MLGVCRAKTTPYPLLDRHRCADDSAPQYNLLHPAGSKLMINDSCRLYAIERAKSTIANTTDGAIPFNPQFMVETSYTAVDG